MTEEQMYPPATPSPVVPANIETMNLPPMVGNGPPDTYQSQTVMNILNADDDKFNGVVSYAIQDPDLDDGYRMMIQQEGARRALLSQDRKKVDDIYNRVPPTEVPKILAQTKEELKTDIENDLPRPLTDRERRAAAFSAVAYSRLGLPELAKRYEEIAYPKPTYSGEMLMDGSRYTVQRDPYGRVITAYDSTGRRVSGEEFGKVSAGGLLNGGKGLPEASFTIGYDDKQVPYSKHTVGGQLFFTNKHTGAVSNIAPKGYHENEGAQDNAALSLYTNVYKQLTDANTSYYAQTKKVLYSQDDILKAAAYAAANVHAQPSRLIGGGKSVSNDNQGNAIQDLNVPANQPVARIASDAMTAVTGQPVATTGQPVAQLGQPAVARSPDQPVVNDVGAQNIRLATQISQYDAPPLSPDSISNKEIMDLVYKLNPNYRSSDYDTQKAVELSFAGDGENARSLRVVKNAWGDLSKLSQAALALKNGNTQLFNKLSNDYGRYSGNPVPTNFETMKIAVAGEVSKAIKGGVATSGELERVESIVSSASSEKQLIGALAIFEDVVIGRTKSLKDSYTANGGKPEKFNKLVNDSSLIKKVDLFKVKKLSPEQIDELIKRKGGAK